MIEHMVPPARRWLIAGVVVVLGLSFVSQGKAAGDSMTEVERTNDAVVTRALAALAKRDVDALGDCLADDFTYRYANQSVNGKANYLAIAREKFPTVDSLKIDVVRSSAIGNTVLLERFDAGTNGGKKSGYHISAFFYVVDGKIHEWTDYPWPAD